MPPRFLTVAKIKLSHRFPFRYLSPLSFPVDLILRSYC